MLQPWFDGVYLIGQFNWLRTGCWLLVHGNEAAILEMPPAGLTRPGPAVVVQHAVAALSNIRVKYLLCTHTHPDHFARPTFRSLIAAFPAAEPVLQAGFRRQLNNQPGVRYFEDEVRLELGGEPLYLVHAPKHSQTDTMVVFRGAVCTGDWELGTLRSVHDWTKVWAVPQARKLAAIDRMEQFPADHGYVIHQVYSVHANDRREGVDFPALMASTRQDRPPG